MKSNRVFYSRSYWKNYINSIIESVKEDEDTIIDLLMYGRAEKAEIIMKISGNSVPSYQVKIHKMAEKSPFGEEDGE